MIFPTAQPRLLALCLSALLPLVFAGCGSRSLTIPDEASARVLKTYRKVEVPANRTPWIGSGVTIGRDDIVVVMAFGKVTINPQKSRWANLPPENELCVRVGEADFFYMRTNPIVAEAEEIGELRFAVGDWRTLENLNLSWYRDNTGTFRVHIFIVKRHRWDDFEEVLQAVADANPEDHEAVHRMRALIGPGTAELKGMDFGQLVQAWQDTRTYAGRLRIIEEMGRRGETKALVYCFANLLNGYFYQPWYARTALSEDLMLLAKIYAAFPDGHTRDITRLVEHLGDSRPNIRMQLLDVLAAIKNPDHAGAVYPLLFDEDQRVRLKALDALTDINNPDAANQVSLLLMDRDPEIRQRAEAALRMLGVAPETIGAWRAKAQQLNVDSYYETWRAHSRTVSEKKALEKKLASSEATKQELAEALRQRESAQKTQQDLKSNLYEKERELQSQKSQLALAEQALERIRRQGQASDGAFPAAPSEDEARLEQRIASLNTGVVAAAREAKEVKQQLAAIRAREQDLLRQVDSLKGQLDRGSPPIIAVLSPQDGSRVKSTDLLFHMVAVDDKGVRKVDLRLDGRPVALGGHRGLKLTETSGAPTPKLNIRQKLALAAGPHELVITAEDSDGLTATETLRFTCVQERGTIWAVVVGINAYPGARNLKYAVNDARGFAAYLTEQVGVPPEQVFLLTDAEATKARIESLLGTQLKRKAAEDDSVIIFYAGHGAVETDPSNPDGDGFEKYLLPHDARLDDLYTSSISMNDIRTIFQRIRARRLIFIADTCYSGSAGGRTLLTAKSRANLSDRFLDRISQGKGRVIITSSSANEISKEDDKLGHGIFSYYLLEGLRGKADQDTDGIITVDELFAYLSRTVPKASGQDQHPVKKGEMEGELVIGRAR